MASEEDIFSGLSGSTWGKIMVDQFKQGEYSRVIESAPYFPDTKEKIVLQFASGAAAFNPQGTVVAFKKLNEAIGVNKSFQVLSKFLEKDTSTYSQALLQIVDEGSSFNLDKKLIAKSFDVYVGIGTTPQDKVRAFTGLMKNKDLYPKALKYADTFLPQNKKIKTEAASAMIPSLRQTNNLGSISKKIVQLDPGSGFRILGELNSRFKNTGEARVRKVIVDLLDTPGVYKQIHTSDLCEFFVQADPRLLTKLPKAFNVLTQARLDNQQKEALVVKLITTQQPLASIDKVMARFRYPVFDSKNWRAALPQLVRLAAKGPSKEFPKYATIVGASFKSPFEFVASELTELELFNVMFNIDSKVTKWSRQEVISLMILDRPVAHVFHGLMTNANHFEVDEFREHMTLLTSTNPNFLKASEIGKYTTGIDHAKRAILFDLAKPVYPELAEEPLLRSAVFNKYAKMAQQAEGGQRAANPFVNISLPASCGLDAPILLEIALSNRMKHDAQVSEELALANDETVLEVIVAAPGFAFDPREMTKRFVFKKGSEKKFEIKLFPLSLGTQHVEIEFWEIVNKEPVRVGYYKVTTEVSTIKSGEDIVVNPQDAFEPLEEIEFFKKKISGSNPVHVLNVSYSQDKREIRYVFLSDGNVKPLVKKLRSSTAEIEDYLKKLNTFLVEITGKKHSPESLKNVLLNLRGIGETLAEELVDPTILSAIRELQDNDFLLISSDEQWIPWELLHDGRGFFGERFIMSRHPRYYTGQNAGPDPVIVRGHLIGEVSINKIVNVVGGQILAETDAKDLFRRSGLSSEDLPKKTLNDLVAKVGEAHLLHFTCHGHLDPHMLRISGTLNQSDNLLVDSVRLLPVQPGLVVFANACDSTFPTVAFGKFKNFGWQFYLKGASVFIGTLGRVPEEGAMVFSKLLYDELRSAKDNRLGPAMKRAKDQYKATGNNPFWLLYVMFGDPRLQVKFVA